MSRLTLLLPLLVYLTFDPRHARYPVGLPELLLAIAALLLVPLLARLWVRRVVRAAHPSALHATAVRVNRVLGLARLLTLLWTAPAMYLFGLAEWGTRLTPGEHPSTWGAVVLTLPAYLAWLLLHAAQYPAERAIREQAMLVHLDQALPVHEPPPLYRYLGHQLRTGPGVFVAPVLAVLAVRDGLLVTLSTLGVTPSTFVQSLLFVASASVVFALFPVVLVRLLRTRPLPDGPLRRRLEGLARRAGVQVRDILLWDTGHSTCNAMVTGVFPGVRYVLLSDLLVEALTDRDIEAVFAHELGHIVHRHVAWYGAFLVACAILLGGVDVLLTSAPEDHPLRLPADVVVAAAALGTVLLGFGYLSRRFENQADVFAARSMSANAPDPLDGFGEEAFDSLSLPRTVRAVDQTQAVAERANPHGRAPEPLDEPIASPNPLARPVTPSGSVSFIHALSRVAWLNNLPPEARNFTHGSIASRMARLSRLAQSPEATAHFDRHMQRVRRLLAGLLAASLVFAAAVLWRGG